MAIAPELKKIITERYMGWTETWGLTLAFAVTQNLEKAERIAADAVVALIAAESEAEARLDPKAAQAKGGRPALPGSVTATRFASVLWELANREAFRGFGADAFFRMPAIARAIVVLKVRAQFSRPQIASILNVGPAQIDDHLENARLLFSDGRSWLAPSLEAETVSGDATTAIRVEDDRWVPECPQWTAEEGTVTNLQDVFAHYVGNDLDPEIGRKLHSHLVVCSTCRSGFANFKRQYSDWVRSIPVIDAGDETRKHLANVTRMALKMRRDGPPSAMPGLRRILRDRQVLIILAGAAAMLAIKFYFENKMLN